MKLFFVVFLFLWILSPFYRTFIKNIHYSIYYSFKDTIKYFREKEWEKFGYYGIFCFCGMFGKGKTLSMTHFATKLYRQYGDSLRFISNYELKDIPYIPLINFNQLVDLGSEEDSPYIGNIVLIDEISTLLSHRNFANFPLETLNLLLQQRKKHTFICCSAQRFFMIDRIWRSITTYVVDCNKIWRFCNLKYYDAWEYENAVNPEMLKYCNNSWWFVHNYDFEAYDTNEMISKSASSDFISNEEAIVRKGLDSMEHKIENVRGKHIRKKSQIGERKRFR